MVKNNDKKNGPLVNVLIATYNRRQFLPCALGSVIHQDYDNLEIFVINDGGEDVSDIIESFNDQRIIFINRKENRGLPFTLNEALAKAKGKYVCYLGDDDLYYPHHVSTLVDILENKTDCGAAYSDLYKTYCRIEADGTRRALSKVVEVSRDFDRFFMFHFNHTLHVSLMHRRDLLEKAGFYNENLNVLVDWDLTKRLVFYTDFYHTPEITGEFYSPVGESDRISVQQRKDKKEYSRNVMAIRTTRPPKPWFKVDDMSIIFTADRFNQQAGNTLGLIWRDTFYPYEVYIPMLPEQFNQLDTEMPNLICVPISPNAPQTQKIDAALQSCQGRYITIVPSGFPIEEMWVEDSLYALINSPAEIDGFELEQSTDELWAAVIRKPALLKAREKFPHLSLRDSLNATGIKLKRIVPEDIPFQFDQLYQIAQSAEQEGDWAYAAQMYEYLSANHKNELWMNSLAAHAHFKAGDYKKADELSQLVNQNRSTVDTLLVEAKIKRQKTDFNSAIELLENAEQILEGNRYVWT